jgi:hypothetical protein
VEKGNNKNRKNIRITNKEGNKFRKPCKLGQGGRGEGRGETTNG